jgi:D-xylose transport system substrate-binding protein
MNPRRSRVRLGAGLACGLLAASAALAGCASGDSADGASESVASDDKVLIGVSMFDPKSLRYQAEAKMMEDLAKANGDEILINFSDNTAGTQATQIQTMLQRGVDVLIVNPIDSSGIAPTVQRAIEQGVKVVAYDNLVSGVPTDYGVERDNPMAGKLQVESALAAVPQGEYALIRGDMSTPIAQLMTQHYDDLKSMPGIDVVFDQSAAGWTAENANNLASAALQANPDIKAFVVTWDAGSIPTIQAIKAAGHQPGDIFVTGNDGSPPSLRLIAEGWQGSSTWTDGQVQAENAIAAAHALAHGLELPAPDEVVDGTPTKFSPQLNVTKENLCEFVTEIAPEGWADPKAVFEGTDVTCG